jgi:hypothetical protein
VALLPFYFPLSKLKIADEAVFVFRNELAKTAKGNAPAGDAMVQ